ncbi:MetQ/NlpA family ABC transporter substrate-binding protein [Microvirga pudoricolor]|uniref:MetQ/NlpA family ABC transporter substrate-binding protein n=1 Tax=Microvirga pudoricolor TaxID=2778729 RepID=UPI0019526D6C|nr:MetQ/NlpA family ABC transporter substrate-binding protein [Microvirga pudoricolor]MBM6596600.1 MetQ/NlpA family ABC transporter substrate-binding protein [Microvirga pudoricolor]
MSLKKLTVAAVLSLASLPALAQTQTIRVGVTPGPHAQILEAVKPIAAQKGLDIKIIEFSDYVVPNTALADGELEANSFQHTPYLDNQKADRKFKIEKVAETVNFPIGIYSKKVKSFEALPAGANIAIPNDPTNGGRALLLLQDKGVLKLKDGVGFKPTVLDITDNPKKIKITEIDAAQAPRVLDDVDAAIINTNYATQAGLDPVKDALTRENPKGPYVNIIAVRAEDKDKPWVKTFVEAYHTPEVKKFVDEKFKGAVLTSW